MRVPVTPKSTFVKLSQVHEPRPRRCDCCLRPAGVNHRTIKKLIEHYEISTEHFDPTRRGSLALGRPAMPISEVLVEHSTYSRDQLKRRLYAEGLRDRACELCGPGEDWRGPQMGLILDHINGIATDNRLENLRILCPNCAPTLETHCARKNRIAVEPRAARCAGPNFRPRYPAQRYCSQA